MTQLLIRVLSYPFIVLGFIWQFVAGSFYSGRIWSTVWIREQARAVMAKADLHRDAAGQVILDKDALQAQTKRGLH